MSADQLELTLGPLYVVHVEERVAGALTGRADRAYTSPPQSLDDARTLAALLLDRGGALEGDGPWQLARPGGRRVVRLARAPERSAF